MMPAGRNNDIPPSQRHGPARPYQMHTSSPPRLRIGSFHDSFLPTADRRTSNAAAPGAVRRRPPAKRGADFLARLMEVGPAGARVRPLGGDRAGEVRFARFLHNPHVTPEEMIATAAEHTASLVQGLHVLAIQDTTTLRDDGDQNSLNLHAMIAVDAGSGAMLGPVHAEFLRHEGGKRADCGKRPFEEKESFRWLTATREAAKLIEAGAARRTALARPGRDIYHQVALRPAGNQLGIRAHHHPKLAHAR